MNHRKTIILALSFITTTCTPPSIAAAPKSAPGKVVAPHTVTPSEKEITTGLQLLNGGESAQAQAHFENAVQLAPYSGQAHFSLAKCYEAQRYAKYAWLEYVACAMFSLNESQREEARIKAQENRRKKDQNDQVSMNGERNHSTPLVETIENSVESSERGERELENGQFDSAVVNFKQALTIEPRNGKAKWYLTDTRYARCMAEMDAAQTEFAFHGLDDSVVKSYDYCLATLPALMKIEDYKSQALDQYKRLVPKYCNALLAYSQFDKAMPILRDGLRLDNQNQKLRDLFFVALLGSAEARMKSDDYANAALQLSQALQLKPKSSRAHYQLGLCLKLNGDTTKAKQEFALGLACTDDLQFQQLCRQGLLMTQ